MGSFTNGGQPRLGNRRGAADVGTKATWRKDMPKADVPGVERIIAQTINEAVRGDPDECRMRQLYRSPNGDTWFLARSPTTGLAFVRHQANTPSGGRLADIEIGTFLSGPRHPEQDALLRVIGASIVDPRGAEVEDEPSAEAGKEWSDAELSELGELLLRGLSIEEIARVLGRDNIEVRYKVAEIGRACHPTVHQR
jgi:hypothetical protein